MKNSIELKMAQTATDFKHAKNLILEYVSWLGIDLSYQNFDKEMETADFMKSAIKLYTDNGFVEIGAYRYNPHESVRYYELKLKK